MLSIYKITLYKNGLNSIFFKYRIRSINGLGRVSFFVKGGDLDNVLKTLSIFSRNFALKDIKVKRFTAVREINSENALLSLLKMIIGKKIEIFDGSELVTGILMGFERNMEIVTSQGVGKINTVLISTENGIKLIPLMKIRELYIPEEEIKKIISHLKLPEDLVEVEIILMGEGEEEIYWSYTTTSPGWQPIYKIILGDNTSKLIGFTVVSNNTTYDWINVLLEFSTATPPFETSRYPEAPPPKPIKALGRERTLVSGEIVEAAVEEKESSKISVQNFVVSDVTLRKNSITELPLFKISVDVREFSEWLTYRPVVERKLEIKNTSNINVISGPVSIYLNDLFIGLVQINDLVPGGKTELFLGVDRRVYVEKSQQLLKETTGIFRQGVKKAYETKFIIRNYSNDLINLLIKDRPPEELLKPDIVNANINPIEFKKGFYLWKINLKPKQETMIRFNYVYKE